MFPKIVSLLGPTGAAFAVVYSSLTGYSIMREIGGTLREDQTIVLPSGHLIGAFGLVLLGIGVTAVALSPRVRSMPAICLFVGGMIAFGLAVLFVGYGNWQLSASFQRLATAETVDPESFMQATDKARLPLLVGWLFVLGGAASVFAADVIAERASRSRFKSLAGGIAAAVASFALFTFLVSGVWSVISLRGLEGSLSSAPIDPSSLASGVVGIVNSVFLSVIGIIGCTCASLLLAIATKVPAHKRNDQQMDEREPE